MHLVLKRPPQYFTHFTTNFYLNPSKNSKTNSMKFISVLFLLFLTQLLSAQRPKILFDATKAEMAGNADWVIDADVHNLTVSSSTHLMVTGGSDSNPQRFPTPAQSGITSTTAQSYWQGALSAWGVDAVKSGFDVETLPYNARITYNDATNVQDLKNYDVFVVDEPNILFTATEKTAILNFVRNGGGLFMISDHDVSDRNNDGYDSPHIWNDLMSSNSIITNPFGITFDYANFSQTTTNVATITTDSILHGSYGNPTTMLWANGTTMTLDLAKNSSAKGLVFKTGVSTTGTTNVMFASAFYGNGKVVAMGDSSPADDGSGDPGDSLYDGWIADANGNHEKIIMNATLWLAAKKAIVPVEMVNFTAENSLNRAILHWKTASEINTNKFDIERSSDGLNFQKIGETKAAGNSSKPLSYIFVDDNPLSGINYYRLNEIDFNGKTTETPIISVKFVGKTPQIAFPNPVSNVLVLQTDKPEHVILTNILGEIVRRGQAFETTWSVSDLPIGIYFLKDVLSSKIERIVKVN